MWLVIKHPDAQPELASAVRPDLAGAASASRDRAYTRISEARAPLRAGAR
jgi:hypothetical protein